MVGLLLDAGACPRLPCATGRQPLHDACLGGHAAIVKTLVESSADPTAVVLEARSFVLLPSNATKGDLGKTPLGLAAGKGHHHLRAILEHAAASRGARVRSVD